MLFLAISVGLFGFMFDRYEVFGRNSKFSPFFWFASSCIGFIACNVLIQPRLFLINTLFLKIPFYLVQILLGGSIPKSDVKNTSFFTSNPNQTLFPIQNDDERKKMEIAATKIQTWYRLERSRRQKMAQIEKERQEALVNRLLNTLSNFSNVVQALNNDKADLDQKNSQTEARK